ncbi:uncharacterized protein C8A04DRAFT_34509 [Dichotomopilus funicola]|uniref:Fucose-specific lectin n=1 Tax=Dichotomopilus funicola TaxID=1934379 RepID=A0AAN6ZR40_9PEZI|nr:hypothetical protein C8A04DRAFT_34509 [Dichotomopilus funicola]
MAPPGWWPPGSHPSDPDANLPEAVDRHYALPEVVPSDHPQAAQSAFEREKHLAPVSMGYGVSPLPWSPENGHGIGQYTPSSGYGSYNNVDGARGIGGPGGPGGDGGPGGSGNGNGGDGVRIWGMRKRTFVILVIGVALLVVGIALGVGLGVGLKASSDGRTATSSGVPAGDSNGGSSGGNGNNNNNGTNGNNGNNNSTGGSDPSSTLFHNTSLAATNYTDLSNNIHQYVFFQAANLDLAVSLWDSQNQTWTTLSISRLLASTGLNLDLIPGTPIAAHTYTNPTFQTRVYFLTKGNSIRELITSEDPSLTTSWRQGFLGSTKLVTAQQGSQLATLRPQCGVSIDCQVHYPWLAIAYQGEGGVVAVTRSDDWEPMEIPIGPAPRGSAVGLASVAKGEGHNITDVRWSLFYDEEGELQEMHAEGLVKKWTRGVSTGYAPDPARPNIAALSFDLIHMMVISVDPDRDLEIRLWDPDAASWSGLKPPNLLDADDNGAGDSPEDPKFDAVAGNSQKRVFGVVNGVVHQWEFFALAPLQWSYRGVVKTSLGG